MREKGRSMTSRVENDCPLAAVLSERLRRARHDLTAQWLDRIAHRVSLDPNRVFPTNELLDHVPLLIDGVAHHLKELRELDLGARVLRDLGAVRLGEGERRDLLTLHDRGQIAAPLRVGSVQGNRRGAQPLHGESKIGERIAVRQEVA